MNCRKFETRTARSVGPRLLRSTTPATEVAAPAIAGAAEPSVSMTLMPIVLMEPSLS